MMLHEFFCVAKIYGTTFTYIVSQLQCKLEVEKNKLYGITLQAKTYS